MAQGAFCAAAWAQASAPLVLKSSPKLEEALPQGVRGAVPTFLWGDRTSGRTDLETVLEGDAVLRRGDTVIHADRLEYYQPDDLARARGNVRINRAGNVYEGPVLELKIDASEGFFIQPRYQLLRNGAHGEADRGDARAAAALARLASCEPHLFRQVGEGHVELEKEAIELGGDADRREWSMTMVMAACAFERVADNDLARRAALGPCRPDEGTLHRVGQSGAHLP